MANPEEKFAENISGRFYVDEQCICCDQCFNSIAPEFFAVSDKGDHAYVYRQPVTTEESLLATEALEACPVEAIGMIEE